MMKKWLQTFKEELSGIPMLLIGIFLFNWGLSRHFPNSAFFDFFSRMETIAFGVVHFIIVCTCGWIAVRIVFPNVFKFLKDEFYEGFPGLDKKLKYILGVVIFLVFVLAGSITANAQEDVRHELLQNLTEQLDVREVTSNSSPMIDQYLAHVGFDKPVPWCAAFVSWNLHQVNVDNPDSAWSPSFANKKDVIWRNKTGGLSPKTGDCVTFYYSRLGRVGHVGFYVKTDKSGYFITIEGNTNGGGSREGDGVYMKKRDPRKVYAVSRYIKEA